MQNGGVSDESSESENSDSDDDERKYIKNRKFLIHGGCSTSSQNGTEN